VKFNIGEHEIGGGRTFVIAEIGNNHNGSFERAIHMVDLAVEMGVPCVKFQMRHLEEVYRRRTLRKDGEDLKTEYVLDLLQRFELPVSDHRRLATYCADKGILYLCTPWDQRSVQVLETLEVVAYKVASADLTNSRLLDCIADTGKPLIVSTGMSRRDEVQTSVDLLKRRSARFVLLHCNSTYPAPFHDIQLRWMNELRRMHPLVGYSGHERGTAVSLAAVALGACVIERHFTLARTMEGPDHAASLEPVEFKRLLDGIREIEEALGDDRERQLSQGEMINRENLGKSLVAATDLPEGTILTADHVKVRSPGQGLSPQHYEKLLGVKLRRNLSEEEYFFFSDLGDRRIEPRNYSFRRPWGVPVRYHDFEQYHQRIAPDLFEFHLSYADMDLDPADFLRGSYDCDFVVHAPELFAGSHLMDLATPDDVYRAQSLRETQRVIDITRRLKRFFPRARRPFIVANIGGFTMDAQLAPHLIESYYKRFAESLAKLDLEGVEFTPQTQAPFPWHFGGQRFQNLFVRIDEIVDWCSKLGLRMCFDTSHSQLTCNFQGMKFEEFAKKIAPFTAHLHLGDAKGLNGEGLQVGEGEIDFSNLGKILDAGCPGASFIPEIWQGHKNGGEGFWIALEKLEGAV
jgi:sialic acid synthase SpsE/sugar phosphate isomerase/epimerase